MGSAMLAGWLDDGLPATSVTVLDPNPSDWLRGTGVHINVDLPFNPAVALVAVKPQMMGDALPAMQALRLRGSRPNWARTPPSCARCPTPPPPSVRGSRQ